MRRPSLLGLLAASIAALASATAVASPTIIGGTWALQPNSPSQIIEILVSGQPGDPIFDPSTFEHLGGGDAFSGVNFALTIGDQISGPTIKSVDLTGPGTVFHSNNTGMQYVTVTPRQVFATTTTASSYVGPNGVLAYVELDTTGIECGQWGLSLLIPELFQTTDLPPFAPVGFGVNPASDVIIEDGILMGFPSHRALHWLAWGSRACLHAAGDGVAVLFLQISRQTALHLCRNTTRPI